MTRQLGVVLMVLVLYGCLMAFYDNARTLSNHQNIALLLGLYGVLTVGVGVLIISGGIDLSIGSLVALTAVVLANLLHNDWNPWVAIGLVILLGAFVGLIHGLLVTLLKLQPFLVTLCGLFIYRGLARYYSNDTSVNIVLDDDAASDRVENVRALLITDSPGGIPSKLLLLIVVALLVALLLHGTKYGRYLFAIGANEEATRYAGVSTGRFKVLAYILCSTLAALGGVLYLLENRGASPTTGGTLLELYAITGAVLGGCSLRGGEGNLLGMILGAAALPLLKTLLNFSNIPNSLEWAVIGTALLIGTVMDELLKRFAARPGWLAVRVWRGFIRIILLQGGRSPRPDPIRSEDSP